MINSIAFAYALKDAKPSIYEVPDAGGTKEEFHVHLEKWIQENDVFLLTYLKAKKKQELERSQFLFDFIKDI